MAQYDLIFIKNAASSGVEFAEQILTKPSGTGMFFTQHPTTGVISWSKTLNTPVLDRTVSGTAIVTSLDTAPDAGKLPDALAVYNKINNHLAANDAMMFKGTIGTAGTVTTLPTTHDAGWTYRVITAGTYAGAACEIGDLITSVVKRTGTGNTNSDWTVIQTNIDGAVTGPSSATDNRLALFSGTSGKVIKQATMAAADLSLKSTLITDINALASGTINKARLYAFTKSDVGLGSVPNVDTTNATNITSGVLPVAQVPSLTASKISDFSSSVLNTTTTTYKSSQTLSAALSAIATDVTALETFSTSGTLKRTNTKPASATAAGTLYEVHIDTTEGYMYVCTVGGAAGTARWKRTALASW